MSVTKTRKAPIRLRLEKAYELQYYLRRTLMADADIRLLTIGQRRQVELILDTLEDSLTVLEEAQNPPLRTH